jgi:pSer/pThr/pTyr-binding forkhead associated (FHA) protein
MRVNIFELLELEPSATGDAIQARAQEKRRYFANLLQSAPTQMLRDIYARRLGDIDRFMEERGLSGNAPTPAVPRDVQSAQTGAGSGAPGYFLHPDSGGAPVTLQPGLNIVGRQPRNMGNPIVLDDTYVSANHAVVEVIPGPPATIQLYDIGEVSSKPSTNGVFVNHSPNRIDMRVALFDGMHVRFGQTGFTLCCVGAVNNALSVGSAHADESLKTVIIKAPFR